MGLVQQSQHEKVPVSRPTYSFETEAEVRGSGILERFLAAGREREDVERQINDHLAGAGAVTHRAYLTMHRTDGTSMIVAEFLAVIDSVGVVIGPVATIKQPKRSEVLAARFRQFAALLADSDTRVVVITTTNNWDEIKALDAFGLTTTGEVLIADKARFVSLANGREAKFAIRGNDASVSLNGPPSILGKLKALVNRWSKVTPARINVVRNSQVSIDLSAASSIKNDR